MFKMKSVVPSAFLIIISVTFYLILVDITIWFFDLLLDIFVTESSDWDGLW